LRQSVGEPRARAGKVKRRFSLRLMIAGGLLLVPLAAYASHLVIPFTFTNGSVADATQVNANFSAVATALNDTDSRLGVAEGTLTTLGPSGSPTFAGLTVNGDLRLNGFLRTNYQIASAAYSVSTPVANCHNRGNLPCFAGSGVIFCPGGTQVIGGGVVTTTAFPLVTDSAVQNSWPGSNNWLCQSTDRLSTTHTCYVICAAIRT
jgi:hypothetical protein